MANDISTHTQNLIQQFSESLQRLNDLQSVEGDNVTASGAESAWMLRAFFLDKVDAEWIHLRTLLMQEILPFVRDLKRGF